MPLETSTDLLILQMDVPLMPGPRFVFSVQLDHILWCLQHWHCRECIRDVHSRATWSLRAYVPPCHIFPLTLIQILSLPCPVLPPSLLGVMHSLASPPVVVDISDAIWTPMWLGSHSSLETLKSFVLSVLNCYNGVTSLLLYFVLSPMGNVLNFLVIVFILSGPSVVPILDLSN